MLHVTVIILLCCAVSAPSEGIAVTRRKNYLFERFCLFEEKVPKVADVSSSSVYNVYNDQFPDCAEHKITYRLSFFSDFFINQYQNRKNNYCSIMDSVLERKKKKSGSSVELTYRKRNLLWTQKALQSLKTLKSKGPTTTTSLPIEKHTLNFIEKKRLFAIKKIKKHKKKRVKRFLGRRHLVGRQKNLRERISFSEPALQLSNVILEEKLRKRGQSFPRFHYLGKYVEIDKLRGNRGSVLNNFVRGRESAKGEATHVSYNLPRFRHCRNFVRNGHRKNARRANVKSLSNEKNLLNSNFNGMDNILPPHLSDKFQRYKRKKYRSTLNKPQAQLKILPLIKNYISNFNQLLYDSKFKGIDKIKGDSKFSLKAKSVGTNEHEHVKEAEHSNKQENSDDYDTELDSSESNPDKTSGDPDYPLDEEQFKTKQEVEDFLRKILKASSDYSTRGFNSAEESNESCPPESTIKKPFLSNKKSRKKITATDFDFPDYDEIYDAATDIFLKSYTPLPFHKRREFNLQKNGLPRNRYSKIRQKLRSDSNCQASMNLKRSLLLRKSLGREKKYCGTRSCKSCGAPHRCWKSAPLLCIPYIRKGQDDLLKYLIRVMQKMLGKPYPQKIDIFENTKFKPCIKKPPPSSCEDIIPHDSEDDDDDDSCESSSRKNSAETYDPCASECAKTPAPCPNACAPTPTSCSSCPKGCSKNTNEPSCPSFPLSLPNLNQIYTEPTPCSSEKCFSTLPPFLLPLSSIIQSGGKKISPELSNTPGSASAKPTELTVQSLSPKSNKESTVSAKAPNHSESITFFPPKKISSGYVKEEKEINADLLLSDDQCYQRLNDKILPEVVDYEEKKLLNLTGNTPESESTSAPSKSNEPFLFELPKFFDGDKQAADFSNSNTSDSFVKRNLNVIYEYNDQILGSKNPSNVSPNTAKQTFHPPPSKGRASKKKQHYEPLPTREEDVYRSFFAVLPGEYNEPQIDRPLRSKDTNGKSIKPKKKKILKRHKREDDYNIDDFVNYDGYLYDTNGNSEDYEKQYQQLEGKRTNPDADRFADDYGWTPIQFEMFSELAKIVTETDANDMSSLEPVPATTESSTTGLTVELSSTVGNQLEANSAAATTEKTTETLKELTYKTTSSPETRQSDATSEPKQTRVSNETRYNPRSSSTVEFQDVSKESQDKSIDVNSYLDTTEDGQKLTTVGTAYIAKGPKKQMTKPSPKMYTRVYPDSVPVENTTTTTTTDTAPKRSIVFKTTPAMTSVTPDVRLQLLAVCEGYLEVVKFVKSQNQSFGGEVDSDLSSYCENIISQSFSQQTESSKLGGHFKEVNSSATGKNDIPRNTSKKLGSLKSEYKLHDSSKLGDPVLKRELVDYAKTEKYSNTTTENTENENTESPRWRKKPNVKKIKRKKKEFQAGNQKLPDADDDFLKKGVTKEQVELLRLLKKRKRALLNWLFNSKEDQVQPEVEETEYFDDNDDSVGNSLNARNNSGTVRPRGAKSSGKTPKETVVTKDSVIPVYAKEYGYDKGGELKQVEVLWRKVNDKTHKKQTFKNMSVLALVMTSSIAPDVKKNNFFYLNGYVNEDVSRTRTKNENNVGLAAEELQESNNISIAENATEPSKTESHSNTTVTYLNKPDPSSIIGAVINHTVNTTKFPNITRKIAGKLNKAKGIVEEYTIEFWNYAVYILPIMFSILFLFCCACCAIHILRNKKKRKKKKKKKKFESTDDETSDETDSEPKKKRRDKSKRSKNIWKVWKKNPNKSGSDINDEANPAEKKKSFLRFLKSKKNDRADEGSSVPYSALPESDGPKGDTHSESGERRELIALLEELKKIEMEQVGEKKEQKSVHVQYMIQDHDESAFKNPEMPKGYPPFFGKNYPFHESGAEEYGFYRDAELRELLPCECGYSSKKRGYLRNCGFRGNEGGRCERFFNIFRNAGMHHHEYERKKNFNDKDKSFIFDKYRGTDIDEERNEAGFTVKVCDMSQFNLPAENPNDWVGEVEHFKNQVMKKKHVRLKDDGVLCRL